MTRTQAIRWVLKPAVFLLCLGPAAWLVWAILTGNLSANPLSDITNETGLWTIRFVCITLAITPLRRITGWNEAIRFRRMLGLFASFYGTMHFLIYVIADRFAGLIDFPDGIVSLDTARRLLMAIGEDIYKRPYITVGFFALTSMAPLALTSTAAWIRRLGGKRWQMLHRLIYVTAIAAVVHYWWLVKADISSPQRYALTVGALLLFRLVWARFRSAPPASAPRQALRRSS